MKLKRYDLTIRIADPDDNETMMEMTLHGATRDSISKPNEWTAKLLAAFEKSVINEEE